MINKPKENKLKFLNTTLVKGLIAALAFHIVYSFIFGMTIGGKNPFLWIYEKDWTLLYMIITPIVSSLPYLISGYLIMVGINTYKGLKEINKQICFVVLGIILTIYLLSYFAQHLFPYRDMFIFYVFTNYPAASYLVEMQLSEYSSNLIVLLSVFVPPLMTFLGGTFRIKTLNKGDVNE